MSYGVKNVAVGNSMPLANRAGQEWVREANGQRPQQGHPMEPGCFQDPTGHPLPNFPHLPAEPFDAATCDYSVPIPGSLFQSCTLKVPVALPT